MKYLSIFSIILSVTLLSCDKKQKATTDTSILKRQILTDLSNEVCKASYDELYTRAMQLEQACANLQSNANESNLTACRNAWKEVRFTWESTESWLFGPISANNIDPRIDTWPVDFNAIDSVLNTSNTLNETYIDNLEDALKGFHPLEYFLWGTSGNIPASSLTSRQLEYVVALSKNLSKLCKEAKDSWDDYYAVELANAGIGSTAYTTINGAYLEIANAMSGICEEVVTGKMEAPLLAQDPLLEESPYAKNSIRDFSQNIQGVMIMYQGNFNNDKLGLEDLVRNYNTSLDQHIKSAHASAVLALNAISVPFGEAIISQPIQVQNAINKIAELQAVLENELHPFLLKYAN